MIQENWKIEFDKKFAGAMGYCNPTYSNLIKQFIQNLLQQQKEEIIEKIEKMRRKIYCNCTYGGLKSVGFPDKGIIHNKNCGENKEYNEAIKDIIKLLKE